MQNQLGFSYYGSVDGSTILEYRSIPSLYGFLWFLLGIASIAICYRNLISGELAFSPFNDTIFLSGAMLADASRQVSQGYVPFILSYSGEMATPFSHFSPLYPLYYLSRSDLSNIRLSVRAQDTISLIHIVILYINSFLFGRVLGLRPPAAAIGALLVAISPSVRIVANFPFVMSGLAWCPLVLTGFLAVLRHQAYLIGPAMMVLGIGLTGLASPANMSFLLTVVIGSVYGALWLVMEIPKDGRPLQRVGHVSLALAVAIAGAVVVLSISTLSLLQAMDMLVRWTRTGPVIGSEKYELFEILLEKEGILNIYEVFTGEESKKIIGSFFLGPIILCLIALGIFLKGRSYAFLSSIILLVCIVYIFYIDPLDLIIFAGYLPGFSAVRHLSYLGFAATFGGAFAAASAYQALADRSGQAACSVRAGMLLIVALFGIAFVVAHSIGFAPRQLSMLATVSAAVLGLLAVGALVVVARPVAAAIAGVLLMGSQIVLSSGSVPTALRQLDAGELADPIIDEVGGVLSDIAEADGQGIRVAFHPSLRSGRMNNLRLGGMASFYGLRTLQYSTSPMTYFKFRSESNLFNVPSAYPQLAVRYIVSAEPLDWPNATLAYQHGIVRAYRLLDAVEPVAIYCFDAMFLADAVGESVNAEAPYPGTLPRIDLDLSKAGRACPASVSQDRSPQAAAWFVTVRSKSPAVVVIAEAPYRYWRATFNGAPVQLYSLASNRIVAVLPPGRGVLSLRFMPAAYTIKARAAFAVIMLACLTILVGGLYGDARNAWHWFRRRRVAEAMLGQPRS